LLVPWTLSDSARVSTTHGGLAESCHPAPTIDGGLPGSCQASGFPEGTFPSNVRGGQRRRRLFQGEPPVRRPSTRPLKRAGIPVVRMPVVRRATGSCQTPVSREQVRFHPTLEVIGCGTDGVSCRVNERPLYRISTMPLGRARIPVVNRVAGSYRLGKNVGHETCG